MPSPFPGMDPWLEQPGLWENLHTSLITALRDVLGPVLRPRYYVAIEESIYVMLEASERAGQPDVSMVAEPARPAYRLAAPPKDVSTPVIVEVPYSKVSVRRLEVRRPKSREVVTAVEILSPTNKRPGEGRDQYELKRRRITQSRAHLVEIDLLRNWAPMHFLWPGNGHATDYRILASRADSRPSAELYPFNVRDPIPRFRLPLQPDDDEPIVDLKPLLDGIYDRAGFDLVIDYSLSPDPPLTADDAGWANEMLVG